MSAPAATSIPAGSLASSDQAAAGFYPPFTQRVAVLATNYALTVMGEDTSTDNHAARLNYARLMLQEPPVITANQLIWAVVADLVTTTSATDSALLARISAVWNGLAGPGS